MARYRPCTRVLHSERAASAQTVLCTKICKCATHTCVLYHNCIFACTHTHTNIGRPKKFLSNPVGQRPAVLHRATDTKTTRDLRDRPATSHCVQRGCVSRATRLVRRAVIAAARAQSRPATHTRAFFLRPPSQAVRACTERAQQRIRGFPGGDSACGGWRRGSVASRLARGWGGDFFFFFMGDVLDGRLGLSKLRLELRRQHVLGRCDHRTRRGWGEGMFNFVCEVGAERLVPRAKTRFWQASTCLLCALTEQDFHLCAGEARACLRRKGWILGRAK